MADVADPRALDSYQAVPLSTERLAELGLLTATFGQMDFLINQLISFATKTPWWAMMAMIDGTTTGTKLGMLRKIGKSGDKAKDAKVAAIVEDLGPLLHYRNMLIHGVWVIRMDPKTRKGDSHLWYSKENKWLSPKKLGELVVRAQAATKALGSICDELTGQPTPERGRFHFVADGEVGPDLLRAAVKIEPI